MRNYEEFIVKVDMMIGCHKTKEEFQEYINGEVNIMLARIEHHCDVNHLPVIFLRDVNVRQCS